MIINQPWQGALWLGPDYCLVGGKAGQTHRHAHYAHQALLALGGEVCARVQGLPQCGPLLLIESMREHEILIPDQPMIAVYAEPLAFDLTELQRACEQAGPDLERLAERLHHTPRRPLDPRLIKAMEQIRAVGEEALPAHHLAREAALSVSQLERLFSGSLGLSVRRLVLWQRLRRALALALAGSSLTDAAHAAGFADSAHLSRSIRRQFGIRADRTVRHLALRLLD